MAYKLSLLHPLESFWWKKRLGASLYQGVGKAVKVGEWDRCNLLKFFVCFVLFCFWNFKLPFWKISAYNEAETLKPTKPVWIVILLLDKQKTRCNFDIQNFHSEILFFSREISRSDMFLWRQNYVTPQPIVLILVCMDRGDQYLLIPIPSS